MNKFSIKKILPNSLFSRLFSLILIAIILSHVLTFIVLRAIFTPANQPPEKQPPPFTLQQLPPHGIADRPPHEPFLDPDHPRPPPRPPFGERLFDLNPFGRFTPLIVQCVVLSIAAWLATKWMSKPIKKLADAAIQLGENLNSPPLDENGPTEVKQAAAAFNLMQSRIREDIDERRRILGAISHDLRTPLTRMQLRVEKLNDSSIKSKLVEDVSEMSDLLNAGLDYLRGHLQPEPLQRIDAYALIEALADNEREHGNTIWVQGKAKPIAVKPMALRRCLANLIQNAIYYGNEAFITLSDSENYLSIYIKDKGPGIDEEQLKNVFEPFYRIDKSRNSSTGGIGLGLTIARDVALQHGGSLTLENAIDGGLIATLKLPRNA